MAKIRSGKPHPRHGSTAAQDRHNAEIRDLKNQIFARDVELENLRERLRIERADAQRMLAQIGLLEKPPIAIIDKICAMTVTQAVSTGISESLAQLALYSARMKFVASGNKETP